MRDIKFRAYDTYNKEMLKVNNLDFTEKEIGIRTDMYSDYFNLKEMILMQYTGLQDKNGIEIYEGDIIETHFIVEGTEIRAVVFERGTFAIDDSEDYKPLLNEFNHCSKVIGNIYDNPELLEEE